MQLSHSCNAPRTIEGVAGLVNLVVIATPTAWFTITSTAYSCVLQVLLVDCTLWWMQQ